ncbi:hypothetical protein SAMN02745157_4434 [Kaistia soli DSM 19436]|uniref:Uncharacterized protein n=1 Tax=Kaistia soli DSM 19436 TaxID=1122133 RepID=A0A1M5KMW4_9HYPH|nr:hypothetical protein [Kaistia soli]SHG53809.1 hypothetical protein SAMN02745157_4434 [Kaistia soli DSM 19436]
MSRAIFLTGTASVEPPVQPLAAGPLSASYDRGALRWVRWHSREILRGLSFLVRTPGWGTPDAEISDLTIEQDDDFFALECAAHYRNGSSVLSARIRFAASTNGTLEATATILPATDFETNRTGFVVLHPLDGVVGQRLAVEHASGGREEFVMPEAISPGQPLLDIRAITHSPEPGLSVEVRFAGDVFEMEDQRNWSDASFKTYSRPIGLPYPYRLEAGTPTRQSVTITIKDDVERSAVSGAADDAAVAEVAVGAPTGVPLPRIAVGLPARLAAESLAAAPQLALLAGARLLLRYDPAAGDVPDDIEAAGKLASAADLPVSFELLITAEADPRPEVAAAARLLAGVGITPLSVAVFPKVDEASFQPGEARPPAPNEPAIHQAVRESFPGIPAGGGSPAFFTELNRKRPPPGTFDFITHATAPTVHAADDLSVIETLQSLPHILRSAGQIAGDAPHHIGPIGIGARLNPYGPGPTPNPQNRRVGLADADPRQRALLGAAWHVGYAATVAAFGIDTLALGAPVGPFGLVSTPQAYARPWWDGAAETGVYPLFHVVADLAAAAGKERLAVDVSHPSIAALGWILNGNRQLLLANLSERAVTVRLTGLGAAGVRTLDAAHFENAATRPEAFRSGTNALSASGTLELDAYAVAMIFEGETP